LPALAVRSLDWLFGMDIDIDIHTAVGLIMTTQQLLLRLPEDLVRRFKRAVAPRERSKFVQHLLEQALPPDEVSDSDPLYHAALEVERDEALAAEMEEWETTTIADGLPPESSRDRSR
jgi:hypothetical protein